MESNKKVGITPNTDSRLSVQAKKILAGLDLVSQRLIKDAKEKKEELIVAQDGKIVRLSFK